MRGTDVDAQSASYTMTTREKVAIEIDGLMDNARHDCNTNRAVAVDRILAIVAEDRDRWMRLAKKNDDYENALQARAEKAEAREAALREALALAFAKMTEASYQGHSSHWDSTMQHGAGCPECIRASRLRDEAKVMWDAALAVKEGK